MVSYNNDESTVRTIYFDVLCTNAMFPAVPDCTWPWLAMSAVWLDFLETVAVVTVDMDGGDEMNRCDLDELLVRWCGNSWFWTVAVKK